MAKLKNKIIIFIFSALLQARLSLALEMLSYINSIFNDLVTDVLQYVGEEKQKPVADAAHPIRVKHLMSRRHHKPPVLEALHTQKKDDVTALDHLVGYSVAMAMTTFLVVVFVFWRCQRRRYSTSSEKPVPMVTRHTPAMMPGPRSIKTHTTVACYKADCGAKEVTWSPQQRLTKVACSSFRKADDAEEPDDVKSQDSQSVTVNEGPNTRTTITRHISRCVWLNAPRIRRDTAKGKHQHGYTYASPNRKGTDNVRSSYVRASNVAQPEEVKSRWKGSDVKSKLSQIRSRYARPVLLSSLRANTTRDTDGQKHTTHRTRIGLATIPSSPSPSSRIVHSNSTPQQTSGHHCRRCISKERQPVRRGKVNTTLLTQKSGAKSFAQENEKDRLPKTDWPGCLRTQECARRNTRLRSVKKSKKPGLLMKSKKVSGQKKTKKIRKKRKSSSKSKNGSSKIIKIKRNDNMTPENFLHFPEPCRGLRIPVVFGPSSSLENESESFTIKRTATPVLSSLLGQGAFRTCWPHPANKPAPYNQEVNDNGNTGRHNPKFLNGTLPDSNETSETFNSCKLTGSNAWNKTKHNDKTDKQHEITNRKYFSECTKLHEKIPLPLPLPKEIRAQFPRTQTITNMRTTHIKPDPHPGSQKIVEEGNNSHSCGSRGQTLNHDKGKKRIDFWKDSSNIQSISIYQSNKPKNNENILLKHNQQSSKAQNMDYPKSKQDYNFKWNNSSTLPVPLSNNNFEYCKSDQNTSESFRVHNCSHAKCSDTKSHRDEDGRRHYNQAVGCPVSGSQLSGKAYETTKQQIANTNKRHEGNEKVSEKIVFRKDASRTPPLENACNTDNEKSRSMVRSKLESSFLKKQENDLTLPCRTSDYFQLSSTSQVKDQPFHKKCGKINNETNDWTAGSNVVTRKDCFRSRADAECKPGGEQHQKVLSNKNVQHSRHQATQDLEGAIQRFRTESERIHNENEHNPLGDTTFSQNWLPKNHGTSQPVATASDLSVFEDYFDNRRRCFQGIPDQDDSSVPSTVCSTSDAVSESISDVQHKDVINKRHAACSHCIKNQSEKPAHSGDISSDPTYYAASFASGDNTRDSPLQKINDWKPQDEVYTEKPALTLNVIRGHAVKRKQSLISLRNMLSELTSHIRENQSVTSRSKSSHGGKPKCKTILYFKPLRRPWRESFSHEQRNVDSQLCPSRYHLFNGMSSEIKDRHEINGKCVHHYKPRTVKNYRHAPYPRRVASSSESTVTPSSGHYWKRNKNNCSPSRKGRYVMGPQVDKHVFSQKQAEANTSQESKFTPDAISRQIKDSTESVYARVEGKERAGVEGKDRAGVKSKKRALWAVTDEYKHMRSSSEGRMQTEDAGRAWHDNVKPLTRCATAGHPITVQATHVQAAGGLAVTNRGNTEQVTNKNILGCHTTAAQGNRDHVILVKTTIGHIPVRRATEEQIVAGRGNTEQKEKYSIGRHTVSPTAAEMRTTTEQLIADTTDAGHSTIHKISRRHSSMEHPGKREARYKIIRQYKNSHPSAGVLATGNSALENLNKEKTPTLQTIRRNTGTENAIGDPTVTSNRSIDRTARVDLIKEHNTVERTVPCKRTIENRNLEHRTALNTCPEHSPTEHVCEEYKTAGRAFAEHKTGEETSLRKETISHTCADYKIYGRRCTEHKIRPHTIAEHTSAGHANTENKTVEAMCTEHKHLGQTCTEYKHLRQTCPEHKHLGPYCNEHKHLGQISNEHKHLGQLCTEHKNLRYTFTDNDIKGQTSTEHKIGGHASIEHKTGGHACTKPKMAEYTSSIYKTGAGNRTFDPTAARLTVGQESTGKPAADTAARQKAIPQLAAKQTLTHQRNDVGHKFTGEGTKQNEEANLNYRTPKAPPEEFNAPETGAAAQTETKHTITMSKMYETLQASPNKKQTNVSSQLLTKHNNDNTSESNCVQNNLKPTDYVDNNLGKRNAGAELPAAGENVSSLAGAKTAFVVKPKTIVTKAPRLLHNRMGINKKQSSVAKLRAIHGPFFHKPAASFEKGRRISIEKLKQRSKNIPDCVDPDRPVGAGNVSKSLPNTENHMTQTENSDFSVNVGVQTSPGMSTTARRVLYSRKIKRHLVNLKLLREKIRQKEHQLSRHRCLRKPSPASHSSELQFAGMNGYKSSTDDGTKTQDSTVLKTGGCSFSQASNNRKFTVVTKEQQEPETIDGSAETRELKMVTETYSHKTFTSLVEDHQYEPNLRTAVCNSTEPKDHIKVEKRERSFSIEDKHELAIKTNSDNQDTQTSEKKEPLHGEWKNMLDSRGVVSHHSSKSEKQADSVKQAEELHQGIQNWFDTLSSKFTSKSEVNAEKQLASLRASVSGCKAEAPESSDSSFTSSRLSELRKLCVIRPVWKNANVEEIDRRVKRALRLREELKRSRSSRDRARGLITSYLEASDAEHKEKRHSADAGDAVSSSLNMELQPTTEVEQSSFPDGGSDITVCQEMENAANAGRSTSSEPDSIAYNETTQENVSKIVHTGTLTTVASFGWTSTEVRTSRGTSGELISENRSFVDDLNSGVEHSINFQEETPSNVQASSQPSASNSGASVKRAGTRNKNSPPTKISKVENTSTSTPKLVGALVQKLPQVPLTSFVEWFIETSDPNNFLSDRSCSSSDNSPSVSAYCSTRITSGMGETAWPDTAYVGGNDYEGFLDQGRSKHSSGASATGKTHLQITRNQNEEHNYFAEKMPKFKKVGNFSSDRYNAGAQTFTPWVPSVESSTSYALSSLAANAEGQSRQETGPETDVMTNKGSLKDRRKVHADKTQCTKTTTDIKQLFSATVGASNVASTPGSIRYSQDHNTSRKLGSCWWTDNFSRESDTSNEDTLIKSTDSNTHSDVDILMDDSKLGMSLLNVNILSTSEGSTCSKPETGSWETPAHDMLQAARGNKEYTTDLAKEMSVTKNKDINRGNEETANMKLGTGNRVCSEDVNEEDSEETTTIVKDDNVEDNRCAPGIRHILMKLRQTADADDFTAVRPERMKITLRKSSDVTGIVAKFQK